VVKNVELIFQVAIINQSLQKLLVVKKLYNINRYNSCQQIQLQLSTNQNWNLCIFTVEAKVLSLFFWFPNQFS
jgi:hypothetical protein